MLRWSIASVCMGGALEDKLAAAAKAGFRAVEVFENDLTFFRGKPRDARLLAADLGLAIVALQPLRDFEAMLEPTRAKNFERAARKLDLMDELGARLLCVFSRCGRQHLACGRGPCRTRRPCPSTRYADWLRGARLGALG
jgi:4-hydroxyphenylpyruvate dioxygenase